MTSNLRFDYSASSGLWVWAVSAASLLFVQLQFNWLRLSYASIQYIPRNMHTVFALLCFVVVIHWLIFPYPSGLLHWHCGNLTIAPVPAKQPWWIWINTSCEFIMTDCITTTKQSTTKPCAYFLGYAVRQWTRPFRKWLITNWTFRDNFCYWNNTIFVKDNAFQTVVCKMAAILFTPQCVKSILNKLPTPNVDGLLIRESTQRLIYLTLTPYGDVDLGKLWLI